MISIITSTYKPESFNQFENNIKETIGVGYEIIQIHNPGTMSLCEAYNRGIELAQYEYICFSHDDIRFNSINWGQQVVDLFRKDANFGLIGVAGSSYKTQIPTGWYFPDDTRFCKMDLYQGEGEDNVAIHHKRNEPIDANYDEVVTLDGCWFCTTAKVASEFKFDEKLLTGYHCYDLDYAFQVGSKYKVLVMYGLELTHLSHGDYTKDWIVETFKLHEKWKKYLPLSVANPTKEEIAYNEFNAFLFILGKTSENDIYLSKVLRILYITQFVKIIGFKRWMYLQKWTWGAILRKIIKIKA